MELKDLSQNWKKLQATLKQSKPPSTLKRKASDDSTLNSSNTKRRAITYPRDYKSKPPTPRRTKMSDNELQPSASVAQSAEDNKTTATEKRVTVGIKPTTMPHATSDHEKINEGLSPTWEADTGKLIAIDCEMVGVGPTPKTARDRNSALARVSVVNYNGVQLYDSYVIPKEEVTDWRTAVSGISPDKMKNARPFEEVTRDVAMLMHGRVLVGHDLKKDLGVLLISHPRESLRDTCRHGPYQALAGGGSPGLKMLAANLLGIEIQGGAHSSVEDARACMLLYKHDKDLFETKHTQRMAQKAAEAAAVLQAAENKAQEADTAEKKKRKKRKKGKKRN